MEDLLTEIGEFGSYQKSLVWLICFPPLLLSVFPGYNQIFMIVTPNYWCRTDEVLLDDNITNTSLNRIEQSSNVNSKLINNCGELYKNQTLPWSKFSFNQTNNLCCPLGWEYDVSNFRSTIVSEWNLVQSWNILPAISIFVLHLAGLIGLFVFGRLEDRIGKKNIYLICVSLQIVFGVGTAYSPNIFVFILFRFFIGLSFPAIVRILYIIALEWIGKSRHAFVLTAFNIGCSLGYLVLLVFVYYLKKWRDIAFATSVPYLIFFLYWWFLPDSPTWLVQHEHYDDALEILLKVAKINGKILTQNYKDNLKEKILKMKRHPRTISRRSSLFEEMTRIHKTYKIPMYSIVWFANGLLYFSLTWYLLNLGTNVYLSFALGAIVELPVFGLVKLETTTRSRRVTVWLSMILCGLLCLVTLLVPSDYMWVVVKLALIAKFFITASITILFQFSGISFPRIPRTLTPDFGPIMTQIGMILTPLVLYLSKYGPLIPFTMLGSICLFAGISALSLSETLPAWFQCKNGNKYCGTSNHSPDRKKDIHTVQSHETIEMLLNEKNEKVLAFDDDIERSDTPDVHEEISNNIENIEPEQEEKTVV